MAIKKINVWSHWLEKIGTFFTGRKQKEIVLSLDYQNIQKFKGFQYTPAEAQSMVKVMAAQGRRPPQI